jgi:dihydropteroate synthase
MFRIEQHYIDEMIAHAREDMPIECCGVLAGLDGRVLRLFRARNTEASEFRYVADPDDLFRFDRECRERGWEFVGFYHSHTGSRAYPSPTDVRVVTQAGWTDAVHFVVSLEDFENPDVRAYRIVDGQISEEELEIIFAPITIRGREFRWGARTYVMGILNITLDSFSGDGLGLDVDAAVAQGRRFEEEGADILDVGGESTRPGFEPITVEEELRRVVPVVRRLVAETALPVSIDTYKPEVAEAAIAAGAHMLNDVWGFRHLGDGERLARLAARSDLSVVVMHNQRGRKFRDVMVDLLAGFRESLRIAREAGVAEEQTIIDPGFGFGWDEKQNLEMLRRLAELRVLGRPVLIGTSRKSTIGKVLDLPVEERLEGTAATVAIAIAHGADIVRVHDVKAMVRVARMTDAIVRGVL